MEKIQEMLQVAVEKLFDVKVDVSVTPAPANTGADYASNVAMKLAKVVHKNPMVIAQMLADELSSRISSSDSPVRGSSTLSTASLRASNLPRTSSKIVSSGVGDEREGMKVEVAAPGFLNFTVSNDEMIAKIKKYAEDLDANISWDEYKGKTVIAEFSDPNPFKVLHVGHLYTSIVGDSISRLMEFAQAKVVRANFGGDVGLHVAKTLYALRDEFSGRFTSSDSPVRGSSISNTASLRASNLPRISSQIISSRSSDLDSKRLNEAAEEELEIISSSELSDEVLEKLTIEEIAKCYVEGTRAYEEDEAAKAEITKLNKEIYRINAEDLHDTALAKLYWRGRELSYEYFEDFYAKIGVKFDKYYPESTVADRGLAEVRAHTGTTYEESDGAVVYKGGKVGLHTRVFINREGVPTYEAKDVGLIFTKWDDYHFDESVVITGNEQTDYMKVVLASVSEYAPKLVERTRHLTHGLVKLPGNVKMSSRKGNFLKAVDVLQLVREMMGADKADERVVLAAVKYAFLKYKMGGDIVFDPQESVSTTGNSGIYILYSAVRAKKILQKCGQGGEVMKAAPEEQEYEKALCKKIVQYADVLREAVQEKAPYKVCNYLYELAQEFSRFYEHVKVAGSENEQELKQVVQAYLNVMEHGAGLLGIEIPEEM